MFDQVYYLLRGFDVSKILFVSQLRIYVLIISLSSVTESIWNNSCFQNRKQGEILEKNFSYLKIGVLSASITTVSQYRIQIYRA